MTTARKYPPSKASNRSLIGPLPRPKLRVIEGGETWVRDPEEEEDDV